MLGAAEAVAARARARSIPVLPAPYYSGRGLEQSLVARWKGLPMLAYYR